MGKANFTIVFLGDSGGPLHCPINSLDTFEDQYPGFEPYSGSDNSANYVVCGVVSFGEGCANEDARFNPVYTNIAYYRDWINSVTSGSVPPQSSKYFAIDTFSESAFSIYLQLAHLIFGLSEISPDSII